MITALQEVRKLWSLERGTGYIVGKVSDFNVTDTDIRSLYGTRWVTDQVCIPVLQSKSLTFSGHMFCDNSINTLIPTGCGCLFSKYCAKRA